MLCVCVGHTLHVLLFMCDFNTRLCILYKYSSDNHGWYPSWRLFTKNVYEYYISEDYLSIYKCWQLIASGVRYEGHLYSLYTFFFPHTIGVHEESLQRIFMSSYRSPSRNWTVQELIFICLLIQRKRTAICILYIHSSFKTLLVSMKNLYKEYLWVLTGHHHEIELCKKLYLFVCDTWTRENNFIWFD